MEDGIRKKDNGPAAPPPPDLFGEAAPLDKQGNPYAFVAGVIRVNRQTLDKWKRTYTNIPNIEAELLGMERWAGQQDDWFFAVQGSLTKKNRELGLERQRRAEAPGGSQGRPIKNLMLGK